MERIDQPGTGGLESGPSLSDMTGNVGSTSLGGGTVGAGPALGGTSDADDVTNVASGAGGMAGAGGQVSGEVRNLGDTLRGKAREVTGRAKEQARQNLSQGKTRVGERIGEVASAFHDTSEQLRGHQQERLAHYSDLMAERVDRAASYFREREVDDVLRDLAQSARRQPALFLGGAFVLGLLAARFFKSSQRDQYIGTRGDRWERDDWGDGENLATGHATMGAGYVGAEGDDLTTGSSADSDLGLGVEAR